MRLGTFNILHGRSPGERQVDASRLAHAVRELDCDVLALQEVDRALPRSGETDLAAVAAEAMGADEHRFVAAIAGTPGGTWTAATGEEHPGSAGYGIALLSRFPVRSWQVVRLPWQPRQVAVTNRRRRRPRLAVHEPRVAVLAEVEGPSGVLNVAATHLSYVPRWNSHQLRLLVEVLAARPVPRVLMGDLNMSPRRARGVTRMRPLASGATFPASRPRIQIDHILASGIEPGEVRSQVLRLAISDHRALVVDL